MTIRIGAEVEYPTTWDREDMRRDRLMRSGGYDSRNIYEQMREGNAGRRNIFRVTRDCTVGAELIFDGPTNIRDAPQIYREILDAASYYGPHVPTGYMVNNTSAGLHIHMSGGEINEEGAKELAQMSKEPWLQAFACTSLVDHSTFGYDSGEIHLRPFRHSYCNLSFGQNHGQCVNERTQNRHYEWRLPEPMTARHFEELCNFIEIFWRDGRDAARKFALRQLEQGDNVTSVQRARAIGLDEKIREYAEESDHAFDVNRRYSDIPPNNERNWFDTIRNTSDMPYIYHIETPVQNYYAFDTSNSDYHGRTFNADGVEFDVSTVLKANTLQPIRGYQTGGEWVKANVQYMIDNREMFNQNQEETVETDSGTGFINTIVKKKKQEGDR